MRTCITCQEEKPESEFYDTRKTCKECKKARARKWHKDNREHRSKISRKWYENNRERHRELSEKWRKENPEKKRANVNKWRKENPERVKEYNRKWAQKNPDKVRAKVQKRRARKQNAPGSFTSEQFQARADYHGNRCVYCGSTEDLQIEHQIPLSRGGTNWPSNLVPACGTCNTSKGTKTPKEFRNG